MVTWNNRRRLIVLLSGLLVWCSGLNAQDSLFYKHSLGLHLEHGYILPENSGLVYLVNRPVAAVSVTVLGQSDGSHAWSRSWGLPQYGLMVRYGSLGNKKVFGHEFSVVPVFRFPVMRNKWFQMHVQTGLGLGRVSRRFTLEDNFLNLVVGARTSLHYSLRVELEHMVHKQLQVHAGLGLEHLSNANLAQPNIGINNLGAFGGVRWKINQTVRLPSVSQIVESVESGPEVVFGAGMKRRRAYDPILYPAFSLYGEWKWPLSEKIILGAGGDLFFDGSGRTDADTRLDGIKPDAAYDVRLSSGLHLSQEFRYRKLGMILQEGLYLGLKDVVSGERIYHRGIFRHYLNNHWMVQLSMKSHWFVLDFAEIGVGYKW